MASSNTMRIYDSSANNIFNKSGYVSSRYSTNNVMIEQNESDIDSNRETKISKNSTSNVYLPAFMRLSFQSFNDINLVGLNASIDAEIELSVFYGQLAYAIAKQLEERPTDTFTKGIETRLIYYLENQIVLLFPKDPPLRLSSKIQTDQKMDIITNRDDFQKLVTISLTKSFNLYLDSDIYYTPFQLIHSIMEINIQPLIIKMKNQKQKNKSQKIITYKINFNLMDNKQIRQKIVFTNRGSLGNYDLAQNLIRANYENERIYDHTEFQKCPQQRLYERQAKLKKKRYQATKEKSQSFSKLPKVEGFHYAYFDVPLYKKPWAPLLTIFLPLFLLDIISFGVFFQQTPLGDRIQTIAILILAYIGIIPTIRKQIPPSPQLLFVQRLVYGQVLTIFLALVQSLFFVDGQRNVGRQYATINLQKYEEFNQQYYSKRTQEADNPTKYFNPYQSLAFYFFLFISIFVAALTFILILLKSIYYCCWQYPNYNKISNRIDRFLVKNFQRLHWQNIECDWYFAEIFDQRKIKSVIYLKKKKEQPDVYSDFDMKRYQYSVRNQ